MNGEWKIVNSEKRVCGSFPQHYPKSMHRGCSVLYGQNERCRGGYRGMYSRMLRQQRSHGSASTALNCEAPARRARQGQQQQTSERASGKTQARSFEKADSDRSGQVAALAGGDPARRLIGLPPRRSSGWRQQRPVLLHHPPKATAAARKLDRTAILPQKTWFISHPKTWQVGQL